MANCSNCYNGCTEIVSDKCVKYTGVNVPALGILKGDSLSYVEQALITFLTATLNGSGITITLDDEDYCNLVSQYLLECSTVTALDLFKALVKAACNLQGQVDAVVADVATIEANYTLDCLTGVAAGDGTHAIVQAIITKLCAIDTSLTALATDVDTNYVKISDINSYIAAYIASTASATRYSSRMVPYSFVPYVGSLSNFDVTGAGLPGTEWEDIYLCNGLNGTPDFRGRGLVGAISAVPGGVLPSDVNPGSSAFNPNYALGDTEGDNSVTLDVTQIPSHTHVATSTVSPNPHSHTIDLTENAAGNAVATGGSVPAATDATSTVDLTVSTTNADTGGGQAHSVIQPVRAVYFIMYIPA